MESPKLVKDHSGEPVQGALGVKSNRKIQFAAATGAARISGETAIARIVTSVNCYVAFGGATIEATANDIFMVANRPELFAIREDKPYIAFKGSGEIGYAYVACLE
jgi:hypothetical protein